MSCPPREWSPDKAEAAISSLCKWYVRHNVPLDFSHLAERVLQFNNEVITRDVFISQLKDRLTSANINQVKADVLPFVRNPKELDIWSTDYFVQLADMIKFE